MISASMLALGLWAALGENAQIGTSNATDAAVARALAGTLIRRPPWAARPPFRAAELPACPAPVRARAALSRDRARPSSRRTRQSPATDRRRSTPSPGLDAPRLATRPRRPQPQCVPMREPGRDGLPRGWDRQSPADAKPA